MTDQKSRQLKLYGSLSSQKRQVFSMTLTERCRALRAACRLVAMAQGRVRLTSLNGHAWATSESPASGRFVEFAGICDGDGILDLGCETGSFTGVLSGSHGVKSIVGVDLAEVCLESARQTIQDPRVSFKAGDATSLSFYCEEPPRAALTKNICPHKDICPSQRHGPPNWRPILSIPQDVYQRGPTPTPTPTPPGPTPIPTLGPSL